MTIRALAGWVSLIDLPAATSDPPRTSGRPNERTSFRNPEPPVDPIDETHAHHGAEEAACQAADASALGKATTLSPSRGSQYRGVLTAAGA